MLPIFRTESIPLEYDLFTKPPSKNQDKNSCIVVMSKYDVSKFEKYGDSVLRICLHNKELTRKERIYLEQTCVVCNNLHDVERFLRAENKTSISYRIDGYNGVRFYYFHLLFKGGHFLPNSLDVDVHKIILRDTFHEEEDTYLVVSRVKSIVEYKHSIGYISKLNIHKLNQRANVFVPQSWNIDSFSYPSDSSGKVSTSKKGVYIAKPLGFGASSGRGITVFDTQEGFEQAKETIFAEWQGGVVSEYIRNPYLFQGKKFHLRCYIFASTTRVSSLYPDAEILTASSLYKDGDYSNKSIHDSHASSTDDNYYFFKSYPGNKDKVWKQVEVISRAITSKKYVGYKEADKSYMILGADILIDSKEKCWLLEVNFKPGMDPINPQNYKIFERKYQTWEVGMIEKLLG